PSAAQAVYYTVIPSAGGTTVTVVMEGTAPTWIDSKQGYYASAASTTRYIGGNYINSGGTYEGKWLYQGQGLRYYSELIGGTWHKVDNPATDWKAQKTSGWTADSFASGLTVTFSEVPTGTKAIRLFIWQTASAGAVYWRKNGDANISNTPEASAERSNEIIYLLNQGNQSVIWLSSDYKAQFAVQNTGIDLQISYPTEYLI
ncbi:hypothetical protein LCGC14_1924310, partial [marine sediment metagenome]